MKANNRFEKSLVVNSIVDIVRAEGGRFLKRDFHRQHVKGFTVNNSGA